MIYKHHLPDFLIGGLFPLHITVIGAGGTGSQVVNNLARINCALLKLGHPGLLVTLFDDDVITEANLARQLFATSELGLHKSVALITRINRFYGFNWIAIPKRFDKELDHITNIASNLLITCVDKLQIRKEIYQCLQLAINSFVPTKKPAYNEAMLFYWMDFGNSKSSGQVILGTVYPYISQLKEKNKQEQFVGQLKLLFDLYKDQLDQPEDEDTPSCSLAEALSKQDLFINSTLAQVGCQLLWKLIHSHVIYYQGAFLNLDSYSLKPIKITPYVEKNH